MDAPLECSGKIRVDCKKKTKCVSKNSEMESTAEKPEVDFPNRIDIYDSDCEDLTWVASEVNCREIEHDSLSDSKPAKKASKGNSKPKRSAKNMASRSSAPMRSRFFCSGIEKNHPSDESVEAKTDTESHMPGEYYPPNETSSRQRRRRNNYRTLNGMSSTAVFQKPSSRLIKALDFKHDDHESSMDTDVPPHGDSNRDPTTTSGEELESTPVKTSNKRPKRSIYFNPDRNAVGQRNITNKAWVPPVSVHGLIQEELYKDPWKVLVACMLLNKTSGLQMRRAIWNLFALCPSPEIAISTETEKIEEVIRPLGLQKKRARMIKTFSDEYLHKDWSNVGELHGIGKYAIDAYAIFCEGRWKEVVPKDHKLVDYWKYLCDTDGLGYAFKDNRENGTDIVSQPLEA